MGHPRFKNNYLYIHCSNNINLVKYIKETTVEDECEPNHHDQGHASTDHCLICRLSSVSKCGSGGKEIGSKDEFVKEIL